jgi:glyceraldehyde 3-phosphate dehydrogenase
VSVRVGINGFGRMGRLVVRALREQPGLELVHVNELKGGVETAAHLLEFDTVHGRYPGDVDVDGGGMVIDGRRVSFSDHASPGAIDWAALGVDLVIESSGKFKTARGDRTAPRSRGRAGGGGVSGEEPGRVERGDGLQRPPLRPGGPPDRDGAASCTTNCLAPVVKVLHERIGIERGAITTVHDVTNTQVIVDAPHKDLRRARSALNSLVPTSTGSATAITLIYPELQGKLNGIAVRVPLLNASLTDCVFTMSRDVTADEVNGDAAGGGGGRAARGARVRGAAVRVGRLHERHELGHRRRAVDDGDRRADGEGPRLVRQRVRLRASHGRTRWRRWALRRSRPTR